MFFSIKTSLSSRIKLGLALWLGAEALAFVLVAHLIGFPEAMLLGFLTSLFGWTLLKRAGASAMVKLRAALDGRRIVEGDGRHVLDDTLATFGALALLMPGFISDAVGLALAAPAARDRIAYWIGRGRLSGFLWPEGKHGPKRPSTIDLDPADWERTDTARKPVSKY